MVGTSVRSSRFREKPCLIVSRNYCNDPLAVIRYEDLLTFLAYALETGWVSYIRKGRTTMRTKFGGKK